MGPVSFEGLDGGSSREAAMAMAATLRQVGIRVIAVNEESQPHGSGFRVVIRSADLDQARRVLAAAEKDVDQP